MTKPHLGQKKRILLHQPVNSHCTVGEPEPDQTTHQEASFSILQAGGQTTESGESFLHHPPDTLGSAFF